MAQSQKGFLMALGLIVVAGGAFILTKTMNKGGGVAIPANPIITPTDTTGFRGYTLGSADAPVEITEYADFECPHCANFDLVLLPDVQQRLIATGKARLRYRDWPIEGHRQSRLAAHAAACANDQGKFWEAKHALFQRQIDWFAAKDGYSIMKEAVTGTGVEAGTWDTCMKSTKYAGRIQASWLEGNQLGVNATPTFLINGKLYTLDIISIDQIVTMVDSLAAAAPKPQAPSSVKPTSGE